MFPDIFKNVFGPAEPNPIGMDSKQEHPTPELLTQILGSALIVDSILKKQGAEETPPGRPPKTRKADATEPTEGTVVYLNQRRGFLSKTHAPQGMDDDDPGPTAA